MESWNGSASDERGCPNVSSLPPAARKGVAWIDPLVWARELQKLEKSRALGEVCARLGIELSRAHRAADDAEATLRVLSIFTADVRVPKTYGAFIAEQRRLARVHDLTGPQLVCLRQIERDAITT